MAITMKQAVVYNGTGSGLTDTTSLVISGTPVTNDVIVFYSRVFNDNPDTFTSVSGLGGTWTRIGISNRIASWTINWFICTGANAAGPITITRTVNRNGNLRAWHIGGLTSSIPNLTQFVNPSSATSNVGTPIDARQDQIVLQCLSSGVTSGMVAPNPSVPASGWTYDTQNADAIRGSFRSGYRIPTEGTDTPHNATITAGGSNYHTIENLEVGVGVPLSGNRADTIYAELVAAGYGPGSVADMEYRRLLVVNSLVAPQPLTLYDLYARAALRPRLVAFKK